MKKSIILTSVLLMAGCSLIGPTEKSKQLKAELLAVANSDSYELCLPDKSRAQVIMMIYQEGKDPDHIYQELKPLSPSDTAMIRASSFYPVHELQVLKDRAVKTFSNAAYMNCVKGREAARQEVINHLSK